MFQNKPLNYTQFQEINPKQMLIALLKKVLQVVVHD